MSAADARRFVQAAMQLVQMADRALPADSSGLPARLRAHLGDTGELVPNTSEMLGLQDRVNLQLALDALAAEAEVWTEIGLPGDIGNYHGISLVGLIEGTFRGPGSGSREFVALPVDHDETLACLKAGIILTTHHDVPVVLMLFVHEQTYPPRLALQVAAPQQETADAFLAALRREMDARNAFRGKVVSFSHGMHGDFGVHFTAVPAVSRDQVVLAERDLRAIEQHAIGITEHAAALRDAGQHVKRGLLLYGPPGTGKTHTISYLIGAMPGRTTIIVSGEALGAIGTAGAMARQLQPATIVIEDVDLIGMDRGMPGGEHNPLLFQLLNEMDGLAGDIDVLFVLTTNRVEMLEPALAARPGRVDQAIHLDVPDAAGRARLVTLYAGVEPDTAGFDEFVDRLDGAAPAFIKELARRATLVRLREGAAAIPSLHIALDEMLAHATPVLRAALAGPGELE